MSHEGSSKAVLAALTANVGIAVTKFVAFLLTQSSSLLAESVHSLADSINEVLLLVGSKRARRAPDKVHPFGYGAERYVSSFIVAILLFCVGGLVALHEAWEKWQHPEPIHGWRWLAVTVLLVSIALESWSLRTAVTETNKVRGRRSFARFVRSTKEPELAVVLLEDFGALLGLGFALAGVTLTLATGDGRFDAAGTAAIGVLLVIIAAVLGIETRSLLLGEAGDDAHVDAIAAALVGDGVVSVIHSRTLHLSPNELLVAAKIEVTASDDASQVARAIDAAEARVRASVPIATLIYLEPDLRR